MARLRLLTVAAVLTPLVLAGCGGNDPEPKIPEPAPTASSTPSASPVAEVTEEPTLPPEARGNDEAAAEAFVRYYWHLANYVQATGDVKTFRAVALPSCDTCTRAADYFEKSYKRGGFLKGGAYTVEGLTVDPGAAGAGIRSFVAAVEMTSDPSTEQATATSKPIENRAGEQSVVMTIISSRGEFKVSDWESR